MLTLPTTKVPYDGDFVFDVLARPDQGQPPPADMSAVMRLIDAAYAMARRNQDKKRMELRYSERFN